MKVVVCKSDYQDGCSVCGQPSAATLALHDAEGVIKCIYFCIHHFNELDAELFKFKRPDAHMPDAPAAIGLRRMTAHPGEMEVEDMLTGETAVVQTMAEVPPAIQGAVGRSQLGAARRAGGFGHLGGEAQLRETRTSASSSCKRQRS